MSAPSYQPLIDAAWDLVRHARTSLIDEDEVAQLRDKLGVVANGCVVGLDRVADERLATLVNTLHQLQAAIDAQ